MHLSFISFRINTPLFLLSFSSHPVKIQKLEIGKITSSSIQYVILTSTLTTLRVSLSKYLTPSHPHQQFSHFFFLPFCLVIFSSFLLFQKKKSKFKIQHKSIPHHSFVLVSRHGYIQTTHTICSSLLFSFPAPSPFPFLSFPFNINISTFSHVSVEHPIPQLLITHLRSFIFVRPSFFPFLNNTTQQSQTHYVPLLFLFPFFFPPFSSRKL